MMKQV